jgi:16S rRNA C967 or C1407 C5-methylase (RsmB/RsmF family)/NOL1/NOP2/fmu family ribosome biogenesis protein
MLPQDFINRTKKLLQSEYDALERALDVLPPVSVRINPFKSSTTKLSGTQNTAKDIPGTNPNDSGKITDLYQKMECYEKVPWSETGYYLPERPSFTFDPLFHAGSYYVQEASSMFIEQAITRILEDIDLRPDRMITLDLCAAPGGKSTHLQTLLPEGSFLVSNEVVRNRSMILAENMTKWGSPYHMTTNNDPEDFGKLKHLFDIILADLPCSGEGMFRKDTAGRDEWSIENVKLCASRQRRIIYDVWDALKPGGWLIYSTCTFNMEENENNVYELAGKLGAEVISIPVRPEWNIMGSLRHDLPACRFFPHRTRGEGFFLALMRKHKNTEEREQIITKYKDNRQTAAVPVEIKQMLSKPEKFTFFTDGTPPTENTSGKRVKTGSKQRIKHNQTIGTIYAIPEEHKNTYQFLSGHLHIISAGILLGEYKGKDFIPSISLALNTEINSRAFPTIELSYENAVKYLQKEAVVLPENTSKGYILLTYRHISLGFVKNIGNRANNLYPQEWRIRSRKNLLL